MAHVAADIQSSTALQQPVWDNPTQVKNVRALLASCEPLVSVEDVDMLRSRLADVARGAAHVLQAGDCAEDPAECTAADIRRKTTLLHRLAAALEQAADRPVVRVGRIAGQFAKPRSSAVERIGDVELPAYRGHMVNSPGFDPDSRRPDPLRLLTGYMAASEIMLRLGWRGAAARPEDPAGPPVWTSHESLLLDYEIPMVREAGDGRWWLSSTHLPWVGERTRQPDGPHVALLARIANPVACKVGPDAHAKEVVEVCARLDPEREPGRLTLIARMGAAQVGHRLAPLVQAVRAEGHPVIWLCDPMHGNTTNTPGGKVRLVKDIREEAKGFRRALAAAGAVAGGLHLETTPDDVTECVDRPRAVRRPGRRYTSLCDPRLNPAQAESVIAAWSETD